MPSLNLLYNVLIMIGFGLLLFFARYKLKISLLTPALFYGLFWFFISSLAVLNYGIFPIHPLTLIYVISSFLMLLFAHILLNSKFILSKLSINPQRKYNLYWNKLIIIMGFFFGIFAIITIIFAHGFSISDIFSPSKIILLSNEAYASKVKGEFSMPLLYTIFISIFYSSCIFAGIQYSNNIKSSRIVFLPFVVGILVMLVETTKAPFLYSLILWMGGYFSAKVFEGSSELFSKKFKKLIKKFFFAIILLFLISKINRYNLLEDSSNNIVPILLMKFQIYFFGGLSAFSEWFLNIYSISLSEIGFGRYTFGLFDKERGVFSDVMEFGNNYHTNIYTYFRHIIVDFGVIGSLMFHFLIGVFISLVYRLVRSGCHIFIPLLAISYTFTMWSFIISIFIYQTILVALCVSFILMFFSQIKFKNE
jgi:oligosaccharide repeat unit polymerase